MITLSKLVDHELGKKYNSDKKQDDEVTWHCNWL